MTEAALPQAVIRAEPDGYDIAMAGLMGRQAAGHGFLRAAVAARDGRAIEGVAPLQSTAEAFARLVHALDPDAPVTWIPADHLNRLSATGVVYLADATVSRHARLRLRAGPLAFSICGVTHTTASHMTMEEIAGLTTAPTGPWDALVCTSRAVVETVRRVQAAETDFLRWRLGAGVAIPQTAQTPLIPLGVHCDDFAFTPSDRAAARDALGLEEDVVAGLFVGRLVFHAKAHPYPTLVAFQRAAERTGRPMALIFSGWFGHPEVETAFRRGAAEFAPDVRVLFLDGRKSPDRERAWAAADLFVSPSDNIQETFGLTPVEAMAAGLPVVVSDWDGYKDTVRDGVDGLRVRTWAPASGGGQAMARAYETGSSSYDQYCWSCAQSTAVDLVDLAEAVTRLASDAELRRRMGEAGRARAREVFDWAVVYRQYQALWADLNARRAAARTDPAIAAWAARAPRATPTRTDPFHVFGHYPTAIIALNTRIVATPGSTPADLKVLLDHALFGAVVTSPETLEALLRLAREPVTVAEATTRLGADAPVVVRAAGFLAKVGLVTLS